MLPDTVKVVFAAMFHLWAIGPTRVRLAVIAWLPVPVWRSRVGWPVSMLSSVRLPPEPGAIVTEPDWLELNTSLRSVIAESRVTIFAELLPPELKKAR